MVGRVIRLLAGFYFVHVDDRELRCRARGKFRIKDETPVVGDLVEVSDLGDGEGVVDSILPRTNLLERPPVANITQVVVVAAMTSPEPNLALVDRVLVAAEALGIRGAVFFNKADLSNRPRLRTIYEKAGYQVVEGSLTSHENMSSLFEVLRGQTTVLAGQSGVGKSSLVKRLRPELSVGVGEVSSRTQHGKHTTRHVELIFVPEYDAYLADTPGFSRFDLPSGLTQLTLAELFPEMRDQRDDCRFGHDCRHQGEPGCAVREALSCGDISPERYQSYIALLDEIKQQERSQYK